MLYFKSRYEGTNKRKCDQTHVTAPKTWQRLKMIYTKVKSVCIFRALIGLIVFGKFIPFHFVRHSNFETLEAAEFGHFGYRNPNCIPSVGMFLKSCWRLYKFRENLNFVTVLNLVFCFAHSFFAYLSSSQSPLKQNKIQTRRLYIDNGRRHTFKAHRYTPPPKIFNEQH